MIQVGVVGAGHWGPNLIRNFDGNGRSRVRWVVDLDEERRTAVRERFPGVQVSRDVSAVLRDEAVDALVVATPTATHAELVRAGLESGKHVFVEKPLTDDTASSTELTTLARQTERVLLVGHVFVYNPAVQWIKARIDEGALGQVYYASSVRTNLGPIRHDVNAAWDLAAQDIAIFNYWFDGGPISASAYGHDWINPGVHDAVFATLRYPEDRLVHLHVSWLNPRKIRDITVVADHRMLTYDDLNLGEPIRVYDKKVTHQKSRPVLDGSFGGFRSNVHSGEVTIPPVHTGEPLAAECAHFLDCIETGNAPLTGGPEALSVVRALEAISRSMRNQGCEENL